MKQQLLPTGERGAAAMEFALAAPILFSIVIGATQLATMFFANAGVQHAVASGARVAAKFPTPDNATIRAAVLAERFGLDRDVVIAAPVIARRTDANDNPVIDITLNYTVPVDFVFFNIADIDLSHTRTVFVHNPTVFDSGTPPPATGGGSASGGTTPTCPLRPNGRPQNNC